MPRLFTGLELPKTLATELSMMRGGLTGARWIDVENYHMTLRFIGDIDERAARDVHELLDGIRRLGLPAETRKFAPHVTLARLRQASPMAVANYLSLRGWLGGLAFEVDHFTLFSSRDSVGGGPYVAEATYPLQ